MKKKSVLIYLSIFLFSLFYLFMFQKYGLNLWDEGDLLNGSLRTMKGESVYIDFNGYPPGRYLLGAALFKIFGVSISIIRTSITIMTAIAVMMLYSVSSRIIPPGGGFALIPPILFLVSPAVYYNRFYPIFTIFGIYIIFWYLEKANIARSVAIAISAVLSMFFKLEIGIGIAIISMTVILLKKSIKEFAYFLFTLSLAIALVFLYYAGSIDIYRFIYNAYFHVFKTSNLWGNPFPNLFSLDLWSRFNGYEIFSTLLFYIPVGIYFTTFLILIFRRFTTYDSRLTTHLAVTLFFGIYIYNLVIWRTGFDNLIRCLPPALILGVYLLYLFRTQLFKWTGERIFSYAVVLLFPLWFLYMMLFYGDFYSGSIGEIRKQHAILSMERAHNIYADPIEVLWIKEVTDYIKKNTSSEDSIFAVPLNPVWYFLTDRKNPTYYEWILPGELKTEAEQRKVLEQLKKRMPSFIIYADVAIDNREERRFSNYASTIFNYIMNNYRIEKTVGFFQIWRYGKDSEQ